MQSLSNLRTFRIPDGQFVSWTQSSRVMAGPCRGDRFPCFCGGHGCLANARLCFIFHNPSSWQLDPSRRHPESTGTRFMVGTSIMTGLRSMRRASWTSMTRRHTSQRRRVPPTTSLRREPTRCCSNDTYTEYTDAQARRTGLWKCRACLNYACKTQAIYCRWWRRLNVADPGVDGDSDHVLTLP